MENSNHLTESWSLSWQSVLSSQLWRLEHLYWIENKAGQLQRFSLNRAQRRLHERLWYRNDILKARQLGISTYVAMLMLDMSLFRSNFHCGIIDKSLPDAQQKLAKLHFAWDHLDYVPPNPSAMDVALARLGERIKSLSGVEKKGEWQPRTLARSRLAFSNGSDVRVGTNLRGGTMQFLHVSELAYVSVHAPWRAREIRTGAINTVPPGGFILKESTHEGGRYGVNYELTRQAMENMGKSELSPLDFRFFFFSWLDQDEYTLPGRGRWSRELDEYFLSLERETGVVLDAGQKRWYARMARVMGASMKQEYPGTPQEAFATGEEGSIYGSRIMALRERGRVGVEFEADPDAPTFTAWDLGLSDHTAIWLVQIMGDSFHWLDHYAASQQPLAHYVEKMKDWEKNHGVAVTFHLLPHDAARRDAHGISYVENMGRLGLVNVRVVPRTTDVWRGINTLRELLERSFFHARTQEKARGFCGEEEPGGVEHLELYRSRPPGVGGAIAESPVHDGHSHTADAARTFAEAWSHGLLHGTGNGRERGRRARMW